MAIHTGPITYQESLQAREEFAEIATADLVGRYEKLVDVVCAGAKFGASESLEARYAKLRSWMLPRVPQIEKLLREHQTKSPEKIALLLERLLTSESLDTLLKADDGSLIQRMSSISQALFDAGLED